MPRKALATARAALRFAHEATDERGAPRHQRRVPPIHLAWRAFRRLAGDIPRTNAYQKLQRRAGQFGITWGLLQPV